jgi:uncharacterized membrane protein YjjP (DUF1212 family)
MNESWYNERKSIVREVKMNFLKVYGKSVAMVVVTVLAALVPLLSGGVDATEWVNVAIIGVGAAAVFTAPNVPGAKYTKLVLSVLAAVLTLLVSAIVGGVSGPELIQLVIAAAGALGVYAAPYRPTLGAKHVV